MEETRIQLISFPTNCLRAALTWILTCGLQSSNHSISFLSSNPLTFLQSIQEANDVIKADILSLIYSISRFTIPKANQSIQQQLSFNHSLNFFSCIFLCTIICLLNICTYYLFNEYCLLI